MKTGQINGQQVDRTLQEAEKLDKPTPGGDTRGRTAGTLKGAQTGHRVKEAPTLRDSELLGAGMYSKIPLSYSLNKISLTFIFMEQSISEQSKSCP